MSSAAKNNSLSSAACVPVVLCDADFPGLRRPMAGLRRLVARRLLAAQPRGNDGGVGGTAIRRDQLEIGGRQALRVPQDGSGDVDDVAREPQDHRARGGRIGRQPLRHRRPRRHVGRID
jgi:hypothetical protein